MPKPNNRGSAVLGSVAIVLVLILVCLSGSVVSLSVNASAGTHGNTVQGTKDLSHDLSREQDNLTIPRQTESQPTEE
ncbi:MAG: hypothetical protein ACJ73D_00715 [Pyrinomonadaceae bacterium]